VGGISPVLSVKGVMFLLMHLPVWIACGTFDSESCEALVMVRLIGRRASCWRDAS